MHAHPLKLNIFFKAFFSSLTTIHLPAATVTTLISSACPKCGIVQKSGKRSCCSRGGAWFGACGTANNVEFAHTWHEGIQACNARQSQTVVAQQLDISQLPKNTLCPGATSTGIIAKIVNSTALVLPTIPFDNSSRDRLVEPASTPSSNLTTLQYVLNASADATGTGPFQTAISASIAAGGYHESQFFAAYISIVLVIACSR